jgi:hypothetical protein
MDHLINLISVLFFEMKHNKTITLTIYNASFVDSNYSTKSSEKYFYGTLLSQKENYSHLKLQKIHIFVLHKKLYLIFLPIYDSVDYLHTSAFNGRQLLFLRHI